jgi:hypothetical protein
MDNGAIKTEVQSWLLDMPAGASSRIQGWVNEAIRDATDRYNFRCMQDEELPITVNQQRELFTKPSNWKEHRGEPYIFHQDGTTTPISWAQSEAQMVRTYAIQLPDEGNTTPADEGEPRYLLERETTVDVFPLPDDEADWDNGNWRLAVPYWKHMTAMSADADTNWFTQNAEYYVIWKALAIGFAWNRDEERAALYETKAERQFQRAKNQDKLSQLPDKLTRAVHKDVYAGEPRSGNRTG